MPDQLVASMALWWPLISRFCLSSPSLAATQHWNLTNEDETTGTKGGQCGHWVSFNKKQPLGENKWRMVGRGHPGWLGDELKIENWRYGVTDGDRGTVQFFKSHMLLPLACSNWMGMNSMLPIYSKKSMSRWWFHTIFGLKSRTHLMCRKNWGYFQSQVGGWRSGRSTAQARTHDLFKHH